MSNSYRSVILAITGLILTANSPPSYQNRPDNKAQSASQVADEGVSLLATFIDAIKPSEKDGGCQQGQDKRQSDLCAQWKAADAARDAADYALATLLFSTVGTVLLIWTLAETRSNTRREQRAYVKIDTVREGTVVPNKFIKIPVSITNYGMTPASDGHFIASVLVRKPGWSWDDETPVDVQPAVIPKITMHPNQPMTVFMEMDVNLPEEVHKAIMAGNSVVYARGRFVYRDVFRRQRHTQIQVEFHGQDAGDDGMGGIRIATTGNIST